jgi:curved DNA-binding protein CbpA
MILDPYQPEADLYALLEVSPAAADEEVKRAFYRAIRKVHPDLNTGKTGSTIKTQRINQAKILLNPALRTQYDWLRAEFLATKGQVPSRPRRRRKPRRRARAAPPARHTKRVDRRTWKRRRWPSCTGCSVNADLRSQPLRSRMLKATIE